MKTKFTILLIGLLSMSMSLFSQDMLTVGVLTIDSKGLNADPISLGNLARIELQKISEFEVIDRYDMEELLTSTDIDFQNCYSKTCLVKAGEVLGAEKLITGYVEKFGQKIMIILRLINVENNSIEKTIVNEYVNYEQEVQKMLEVSINNIFGRENDPALVHGLAYTSTVLTIQPVKQLNNGPRVGFAYIWGDAADRLTAPRSEGGYDIFPMISQIGYQQEFQYLSSGNFQALIEVLVLASGMEQSLFIPNAVIMNGFRHKKSGLEIAFGPTLGVRKMAKGYYAIEPGGDGKWHLENEWDANNEGAPIENPNEIQTLIDHRGEYTFFSRWVWAVGKTFRSGSLNIPINIYATPLKNNLQLGLSVGFNIQKYSSRGKAPKPAAE